MSGPVGSSTWFGKPGYNLDQSLRFDDAAQDATGSFLSFTPAAAGNVDKWTYSVWAKGLPAPNAKGQTQFLLSASGGTSHQCFIILSNDGNFDFRQFHNSEGYHWRKISTALYRDPSAWYHFVVAYDSANGTAEDRIKMYVNGERITSFGTNANPSQGRDSFINDDTVHAIGRNAYSGAIQADGSIDGYLAEANFVDGYAYGPEYFGTTNEHGAWSPIEYASAYGTNGWYLPFKQDYTVEGFSTVTYKGNGGTQYIGGVGFQSDFSWIKRRNSTQAHSLIDAVRGGTKMLESQSTGVEASLDGGMGFKPDGFTLDITGGWNEGNANGDTYVAWNWDMGGSNANNTTGSINSVVRANAAYGQSIVSYVGNQTAGATVGHGLSSAPQMIILKNRSQTSPWAVYHAQLADNQYLRLNEDTAAITSATRFNSTDPSSSVFTLGNDSSVNGDTDSDNLIAYCFATVAGYSKFGAYTGNGNANHAITGLGFEPAFLIIRRTNSDHDWVMVDNVRKTAAKITPASLLANTTAVETNQDGDDVTSFDADGFKVGENARTNGNNDTFIYMAFADKREFAYNLDQSGNNNDWTSVGVTESDIMLDSPTNNFCTWNPLTEGIAGALPIGNANLELGTRATGNSGNGNKQTVKGTLGVSSGKWYLEFCKTNDTDDSGFVGVGSSSINIDSTTPWNGDPANALAVGQAAAGFRINDGKVFTKNGTNSGITTVSGVSVALGNIYGIAFNLDDDEASFYINGSQSGSTIAFTVASDDVIVPLVSQNTTWRLAGFVMNCGQDSSFAGIKVSQGNTDGNGEGDFFYAPPSGFLALCTNNLPEPLQSGSHFKALTYTGTGSGQVISGVGFKPDFLWAKRRDNDYGHVLLDIARGFGSAGNDSRLESSAPDVANLSPYVASLNADGYVTENAQQSLNIANGTYVGWHWKAGAGNTAVSESGDNPGGTHNANQAAGFSIVKYVGTGANGTVTHGLGAIPEVILIKNIGVNDEWYVYYGDETDYLVLDDTDATADSAAAFNDSDPTSSVFTVSTSHSVNANGENYIAYCWRSVPGFSQIGSYPGNNNANGVFIHTGFKPAFVMNKAISRTGNWMMTDSARSPDNVNGVGIFANAVAREYSDANTNIDLLSNGFKWRTADDNNNDISETYFYMAFAEVPFKYTTAR